MEMIDREGVTHGIKRKYGVTLRPSWLEQCAKHIEKEIPGTHHLEAQIRLVFEQLLHSEISLSCHPTLETNPSTATVTRIPAAPGVFLQIQEIMDIGVSKFSMWEALREKEDFEQRGIRPSYLAPVDDDDDENDNTAGVFTMQTQTQTQTQTNTQNLDDPVDREPKIPHAMLKLVLTDGKTRLPAIEMAPVPQLSVELPIGTKVLVTRGHVLQPTGTLCLLPDCIQVLGGSPMQYQELTLRSRIERILDIKSN